MQLATVWGKYILERDTDAIAPTESFNLLRWFSIISLVIISSVAVGLGLIATRFVVNESLARDALLTAQFIQTLAAGEVRHHRLPGMDMGELLLLQDAAELSEDERHRRERARSEFLEHLSHLPDALLATIYSPDHVVVWSTNPALIGQRVEGDEEMEKAFSSATEVSAEFTEVGEKPVEQQFLRPPKNLFIENYIPLTDGRGKVLSMVEIYKEPVDLIERVNRGYRMIWLATAVGGLLIYFGLFWIVRRASRLLASQQNQLVANRTYVGLGEMSSAVAHSLRNPLAAIRSSAELAQEVDGPDLQKCVRDIISQVDRMSTWVRELLLCLRPLHGESQKVEPFEIMKETLEHFGAQLAKANIQVEMSNDSPPMVVSHHMLLSQVLNSVVANALEAMQKGGKLKVGIETDVTGRWLFMNISDTGQGMSRQQEAMAFKSFYTTKQGGLGIGLIMVKQIMERFGGRASLSSRENEGTRVCLCFKVAEPDPEQVQP
ncbi:HAMP domain-containing histidine kinase [Pseudomonas sp. BN415]|uniref:sensor histidine kinase n=1 Tax=Pseudomonas sp. BN415 TaxID=2567889 RepID=UPI00245530CC|nr:HAMP domain-containing sensor histidine kinase [Pseudomonas sp. BN415]MDH4581225.1 HAMP domain-containing histidine kinase [Pseudomonas sp. BN415]